MKLSKTNYLLYRDCAHNAWAKIHRPDVYQAKPLSVFDQIIIEAGNEVDVLARDRYPGGVLVERGDAAGTARLVAAKTPVIYLPVFETERFTTACDLLVWNEAHGAYDLLEVKGSTSGDDKKAKDDLYTHDIAFQDLVLRQNGVELAGLYLVRLNSEYVRGETLDLEAFFTKEDFGARVAAVREAVRFEMDQAHDVLAREAPLDGPCGCYYKGRSSHCTTFSLHNPDVPKYSVHDISRIGASKKKLADLLQRGILEITDVPDDVPLSDVQANQVEAAKTGQVSIDRAAIADFLDDMSYPVAFLDYETFASAIPLFPGYRPYDHIPFQFSLDIVDQPGAPMRHFEFLHTSRECPDEAIIAALRRAMPQRGSIVTWNVSFERGVNDRLAERNQEHRDFFGALDVRLVDLMDVFSTQAYVAPGFRGKTSIKSVLPVLVPELSYKTLNIQEGATATARWGEVVLGGEDAAAVAALRADLLAYCGLDTKAMVEIWRVLIDEAGPIAKAV